MVGAWGLMLAAWWAILPQWGWAVMLAFVSAHGLMMVCGLVGGRIPWFSIVLAGCGWVAWMQPGWPRLVALAAGIYWLVNLLAWLWLRARCSVLGVSAILLILHLCPLALGWPWMLAGWLLTGVVMVGTTLNPHSHLFGNARRTLPMGDREVCLTIDDGPTADTPEFLATLAEHEAKAVFFLIGERAQQAPEQVRAILAAGHLIGNHTQTHPAHTFWSYPPHRQEQEMQACQETLRSITGVAPKLFRAPVGFRNPYCQIIAMRLGLRVMGWWVRGRDGVACKPTEAVARIQRRLCPGAILLIHQGLPHSLEVLRGVLEMLRQEGWRVTLPVALEDGETRPANCETASVPTEV